MLKEFAAELEGADDLDSTIHELIKKTVREHRRILFNGNGYEQAWQDEAARRGLSNYRSTPEALAHYLDKKNVDVIVDNGILTRSECESRYEIYLEKFWKTIRIEARTLADMTRKDILPALSRSMDAMKQSLKDDIALSLKTEDAYTTETLAELRTLSNHIYHDLTAMEDKLKIAEKEDGLETAFFFHNEIRPLMDSLRTSIDAAEVLVDRNEWPMPSYRELLFGVD